MRRCFFLLFLNFKLIFSNSKTAILLLRIDEIVSGSKKRETLESEKRADQAAAAAAAPTEESMKDD